MPNLFISPPHLPNLPISIYSTKRLKLVCSLGWLASEWRAQTSDRGSRFVCIKRRHLSWFSIWSRCFLDVFLGRNSRHVLVRGHPEADPGPTGEIISLGWPGNALRFPQGSQWCLGTLVHRGSSLSRRAQTSRHRFR